MLPDPWRWWRNPIRWSSMNCNNPSISSNENGRYFFDLTVSSCTSWSRRTRTLSTIKRISLNSMIRISFFRDCNPCLSFSVNNKSSKNLQPMVSLWLDGTWEVQSAHVEYLLFSPRLDSVVSDIFFLATRALVKHTTLRCCLNNEYIRRMDFSARGACRPSNESK